MALNSTAGPPATAAGSLGLRLVRGGWLRDLAPVLTLVILTLIVAVREPAFVSERNLLNVADASAPLFLLAVGETVIILMGSIDLSLHTIASLSSVLAALWIDQWLALHASANPVIHHHTWHVWALEGNCPNDFERPTGADPVQNRRAVWVAERRLARLPEYGLDG